MKQFESYKMNYMHTKTIYVTCRFSWKPFFFLSNWRINIDL